MTGAAAVPDLAWGGVPAFSEYNEIVYFPDGSSPRILSGGMYSDTQ